MERYGRERLLVFRHGVPVAAIVSLDDFELLESIEPNYLRASNPPRLLKGK
jgi:PHD/YefM family antitoxin component YafN of YafNO toxin-antitoxin module